MHEIQTKILYQIQLNFSKIGSHLFLSDPNLAKMDFSMYKSMYTLIRNLGFYQKNQKKNGSAVPSEP